MKRGRFAATAITGLAVAGLGVGLGLSLTAAAGAATTRAAAHGAAIGASLATRTVTIDCLGKADVRPRTYVLTCADGNDFLTKATWVSWSPNHASGYATEMINDCVPDCARGHLRAYPVHAVFSGHRPVPGHAGELRYTEYTLIYQGTRPKVFNGRGWTAGPVTRTAPLPG